MDRLNAIEILEGVFVAVHSILVLTSEAVPIGELRSQQIEFIDDEAFYG
ncbi:MAG: hypothetical protein ACT4P0_12100 [Panacagrimonas sp.]